MDTCKHCTERLKKRAIPKIGEKTPKPSLIGKIAKNVRVIWTKALQNVFLPFTHFKVLNMSKVAILNSIKKLSIKDKCCKIMLSRSCAHKLEIPEKVSKPLWLGKKQISSKNQQKLENRHNISPKKSEDKYICT